MVAVRALTPRGQASRYRSPMHHEALTAAIADERAALLAHPIYARVNDLAALRVFMRHHVFAVWDFMSLLKALQRRLTSLEVPWLPPEDPEAARLVNEIVLVEESDRYADGRTLSHHALYLEAMREVGASTEVIDAFVAALRSGETWADALRGVPDGARPFVAHTLTTATRGAVHEVAAAFLLGREDVIPSMFRRILAGLGDGFRCPSFRTYLERHVEVDEQEHGPAGEKLLAALCGDDPSRWADATKTALEAIRARRALWDATLAALPR